VSVGLPSLVIDLTGLTDAEAKEELYYLVYLEAIIVGVFALPSFVLFRDHPPTPPRLKNKGNYKILRFYI